MLAQFWPSSGHKNDVKSVKMVVSDRYLKKYSHNPIQTWCVHLWGVCSEFYLLFGHFSQILAL